MIKEAWAEAQPWMWRLRWAIGLYGGWLPMCWLRLTFYRKGAPHIEYTFREHLRELVRAAEKIR